MRIQIKTIQCPVTRTRLTGFILSARAAVESRKLEEIGEDVQGVSNDEFTFML